MANNETKNFDDLSESERTTTRAAQSATTPGTTPSTANENVCQNVATLSQRSQAYRGINAAFYNSLNSSSNIEEENNDGDEAATPPPPPPPPDYEVEDSWWSEIENHYLELDQVPNVTANFHSVPPLLLGYKTELDTQSTSTDSSPPVVVDDFERLHRIADRIKNTMNEQRERTLSENSENSCSKTKTETCSSTVSNTTAELETLKNETQIIKEQSLEEFKEELRMKREARQTAIQDLRNELAGLKLQLQHERDIKARLRKGEEVDVKEHEIVFKTVATVEEKFDDNSAISTTDLDKPYKEQSLEDFKEELTKKRLARQIAVQDLRDEISGLKQQIEKEREICKRLRKGEHVEEEEEEEEEKEEKEEPIEVAQTPIKPPRTKHFHEKNGIELTADDDDVNGMLQGACALPTTSFSTAADDFDLDTDDNNPLSRSRHANIELANAQLALQMANSENINMRGELAVIQNQVSSLKQVVACCKQMLAVKEEQCTDLKQRLTDIEKSFAEHEMKVMSENLRQEYERQLVNIRQLRQLYEERQRVAAAEYENLQRLISIKRDELSQEQEKTKNLEERNENLMKEIENANNEVACLRDECKERKFETAALREEIGAVNTLFSQMVMGFNGKNNLDIDRLTTMLEENRTLLNDMATKECSDGATLPKLLFELVEQSSVATNKQQQQRQQHEDNNNTIEFSKERSKTLSPEEEAAAAAVVQAKIDGEQSDASASESDEDINEEGIAQKPKDIATTTTTTTEQQQQTLATATTSTSSLQAQRIATDKDEVDGTASSQTANNNEKLIVSSTTIKGTTKKQHGHHHRKISNGNRKSTVAAAAASSCSSAGTTLDLCDIDVRNKVTSAQEIIGNLPKVWRVLMELLSHHKIDPVQFEENGKGEDCYKSVETPNGPKAELSVSKTYIKLKDLIIEKKSLVKETNHLKTLNCHLEYRLNEQEKRLSAVSLELTKTWHLVGKMQRQHRQLHTQEQILRYQLQQKRRLLTELKDELEYCRRKWAAARAKNDESQEQCNDLRREFAKRKLEDANNSAESGYSDSGGPVSDEEVGAGAAATNPLTSGDIVDAADVDEVQLKVATAAGGCANYRRKRLREMFEHTRKIKRMQSTSPGRADNLQQTEEVVLRWNSAPPTCGWRGSGVEGDDDEDDELVPRILAFPYTSSSTAIGSGAIPKSSSRLSRPPMRRSTERLDDEDEAASTNHDDAEQATTSVLTQKSDLNADDRACRILRLEEQCKSLIQQVLETSDNRERLEVQLRRFQDEMSPVQYAVPLEDLINKKRFERMTRASSAPAVGCLTAREEEYTRKRSERLERLEEESKQLMSRIKRTSDRGHYLRCSLERFRKAPSREGSFESNTEDEVKKEEEVSSSNEISQDEPSTSSSVQANNKSPLTAEEEAYTARRTARLQRLEEEGKQLINKLSRNAQRSDSLGTRLDTLHEKYSSSQDDAANQAKETDAPSTANPAGILTVEKRIENIEKISANREERLRILEEEGRQLINRLSETSEKGTKMINRIAEREINKQNRSSATPVREVDKKSKSEIASTSEETPVAAALLPTLKNVACSSIVSEELRECVTITTIPSQIARNQGAIPKSKPTLQLLASRPKSARIQNQTTSAETLEDMVKRLQSLPFPANQTEVKTLSDETESTVTAIEDIPVILNNAEEKTPADDDVKEETLPKNSEASMPAAQEEEIPVMPNNPEDKTPAVANAEENCNEAFEETTETEH